MTGELRTYEADRGFGWIDADGQSIFFHRSACDTPLPEIGCQIEFRVVPDFSHRGRIKAVGIRAVGQQPPDSGTGEVIRLDAARRRGVIRAEWGGEIHFSLTDCLGQRPGLEDRVRFDLVGEGRRFAVNVRATKQNVGEESPRRGDVVEFLAEETEDGRDAAVNVRVIGPSEPERGTLKFWAPNYRPRPLGVVVSESGSELAFFSPPTTTTTNAQPTSGTPLTFRRQMGRQRPFATDVRLVNEPGGPQ